MGGDLFRRAEAIRDRSRLLESVRGSGYHDEDRDWRGQPIAPQRNGLPRISQHLVSFFGEYDVVFAAADARQALAALQSWNAANAPKDPYQPGLSGTHRRLLRLIPRLSLRDDLLRLRLDEWNDYLFALYEMGVGLSGAPLEE